MLFMFGLMETAEVMETTVIVTGTLSELNSHCL